MNKTYAQVVLKSTKEETQIVPHQMPKEEQTIVVQQPIVLQKTQYAKRGLRAAPQKKKITVRCLHGEICYKGKLCSDCIAYDVKKDMYNISCDNMRMDHRMALRGNRDD